MRVEPVGVGRDGAWRRHRPAVREGSDGGFARVDANSLVEVAEAVGTLGSRSIARQSARYCQTASGLTSRAM